MGEHQQRITGQGHNDKSIFSYVKQYWILIVAAVLFFIFASYLTTALTMRLTQPHFVSFDIKGLTDDFNSRTAMLGPKATAKDVQDMAAIFNQTVQATLSQYENKGFIILVKPAVVSGMPDITEEVRANVYRNIRGNQ